MSPISRLKHDLANRLREINSANLVLTTVTNLGPFGAGPDEGLAALRGQLRAQLAEQSALTATLAPGCEYFTLLREVRALRERTEEVRARLDTFLEWAQNGAAVGSNLLTEPSVPPSA